MKGKSLKKKAVLLLVSLIIMIGSAWGARGIESQFGNVSVKRIYFNNDDGYRMS